MSGTVEQSLETTVAVDTTEIDLLQAQLQALQAQLAAAQAQNAADAQTIAALQAQVTSLQAQVANLQAQAAVDAATIVALQAQVAQLQSYINGLGLNKMIRVVVLSGYAESGGGIYVPPSYANETVNYTPVYKASPKILPTYSVTVGGFP
jgi:hypothetical protein